MSSKSSPKSPTVLTSPLKFLKSFSRKPVREVKLAVLGGAQVGKSAFSVRYLTRRFIGDYSSNLSSTYPHSIFLDNKVVPLLVWDTVAICSEELVDLANHELLDSVICWADVVFILYSVTDLASYHTANLAHSYIQAATVQAVPDMPEVILVGNKNDIWQERQVVTDRACQEAQEAGYANYFEITTRESLDQVRVVFTEGIRRGLAARVYRRRQNMPRSGSTDPVGLSHEEQKLGSETSPESDEGSSPRQRSLTLGAFYPHGAMSAPMNIITPSYILGSLRKRLTSPKNSMSRTGSESTEEMCGSLPVMTRSRSNTYGGMYQLPAGKMARTRKLSVFEPRTANT